MSRLILLFPLSVLFFVGCGGPKFEVVEVTGTVTDSDGVPLNELKVIFNPDPKSIPKEELEAGRGQLSQAITDENGKYRLKYRGESHEFGAEVGNHLITAIDVLAENSRDNPIPPRISQKYSIGAESDVTFEVKKSEEPLVFDFKLDKR